MKPITQTNLICLIIITANSYLCAMTQLTRKSPALALSAVGAATQLETKAVPVARTAITRAPLAKPQNTQRYRSTLSMPQAQVQPKEFNQTFRKQGKRSAWDTALNVALGGSMGTAFTAFAIKELIKKADDLAEKVIKNDYDMAIFDEELISADFSDAIVRIANSADYTPDAQGFKAENIASAFIIKGAEQNIYFVVTAAHCIHEKDNLKQVIIIQKWHNPEKKYFAQVIPVIVDDEHDVAVLVIYPQEVKKIEQESGYIPSIPENRLADFRPYKNEAVISEGYPAFISLAEPEFYRKKFISQGAHVWEVNNAPESRFQGKKIAGEQLQTFNEKRNLAGASGSPIIALDNNEPYIFGIHSLGQDRDKEFVGKSLASGVGKLPEYLKKARKEYAGKIETSQGSQEDRVA